MKLFLSILVSFALFSTVMGEREDCRRITCQREQGVGNTKAIVNRLPYLAGIRRIGTKEPFCFGIFVKDVHILSSRFCDAEVNTIEAVWVPVRYQGYDNIDKAPVINKRVGTEIMSYEINRKLSPSNAYFKSKWSNIIWGSMVNMAGYVQLPIWIVGFGSYGFIPKGNTEMPNEHSNMMTDVFTMKSVIFGKYFLSIDNCCWRKITAEDGKAWRSQRIFLLESRVPLRCFAETGGPVIGGDMYVYGVVRGHYECSLHSWRPGKPAQVAVSAFVDGDIVNAVLTGNTQDLYPPEILPDISEIEDSSTGVIDPKTLSENDPKRNQTLRELAYYGDDYYYGRAIKCTISVVYLPLILSLMPS